MLLSSQEIETLTARQRRDAQERVLKALGIQYKARPDGSLVVLRTTVEHVLGVGVNSQRHAREPQLRL